MIFQRKMNQVWNSSFYISAKWDRSCSHVWLIKRNIQLPVIWIQRLVFILTKVHIHTDIFTHVQTFTQPSPPPSHGGFSNLDISVDISSSHLLVLMYQVATHSQRPATEDFGYFYIEIINFNKIFLKLTTQSVRAINSVHYMDVRLRISHSSFQFQFYIWLVLVLWWQFPFINFLFV